VLIVILAVVYALVATTIAAAKLAEAGALIHMMFFLVSGLAWVVPAMFLIKWMMKPDP